MEIEYLHKQLRRIIRRGGLAPRLIMAMGSDYNVKLISDYLNCYGLKLAAKLDNNVKAQGKMLEGFPVLSPQNALVPLKDNAMIIVFSPQYHMQMEGQLEGFGYKKDKHFFVIEDFRKEDDSWELFERRIRDTKKGERIYNKIKKKYGNDTHIFIVRGATGDVYLNGLFLKSYLSQKGINNYVLAGDAKGLRKIAELFDIHRVEPLKFQDADHLQQCYKFLGLNDVTHLFLWQGSLYLNRCRLRMCPEFTFMDTYKYYIYGGLVPKDSYQKPKFKSIDQDMIIKYKRMGIEKNKTIILSPFAYSVYNLPIWFWEEVIEGLKSKGYSVFVNIDEKTEINPFKNVRTVFFPFSEAEALLMYSGFFLALRSGLCDIVSTVKCSQVIIYPDIPDPLNLDVHRSDVAFSSLKELAQGDCLVEISSAAVFDITNDSRPNDRELYKEYEKLKNRILAQYKEID